MTPGIIRTVATSMFIAATLVPVTSAATHWRQIDASDPFVDSNGVQRTPGCSAGPVLTQTQAGPVAVPAPADFSFFVRDGNPAKLAVFWDGGGACWDANTCVGSALSGSPVYNLTVDETAEALDLTGGLGDRENSTNPIADYTQVFIPYCTGDLHAGAKDTEYSYTPPGGPAISWTIHHRGFDNVVAVLEWLTDYYRNDIGYPPSKVFLSGASAGGYGVAYAFPAFAGRLPWYSRVRMLTDAANGVITQDFYDRALTPGGVWGVWDNLAPELAQAFSSGPDALSIELNKSLGSNYPHARFGQYTTAFDAVQIFYYNVARNVNSPQLWLDPLQLVVAGLEWTARARAYMLLSAWQTWNYRFYLARGTDHTVIADDKFYGENSARGVFFSDWVDDMINRLWPWGGDWRNVSCAPDCLPQD